jgi:capsular exopolysaccharide synthesis family protein
MTDSPLARYLVPLRRWWPVLAGAVALGLVMAWVTLPSDPAADQDAVEGQGGAYEATHLLLRARDVPATANLEVVVSLVEQGPIPASVAAELGDAVAAGSVESVVVALGPGVGTLGVTAVQPTPEQARLLATTYAEAIVEFFDAQARDATEKQVEQITERLTSLDQQIRDLQTELATLEEGSADAVLLASRLNVQLEQYGALQAQLNELQASARSTFETLQEPVPALSGESADESSFGLPGGPVVRFLVAALLSLVLGASIVFAVDWVDTRVRTRQDVEEAFGLPVIAEFPRRTRSDLRDNPLPVRSDPGSLTAETFRSLRLSVLRGTRWHLNRAKPTVNGDGPVGVATPATGAHEPRVLLVTSAREGEGKSTVAANLAASIAESGKSVLLIDSDFRRPAIGAIIGVPDGPGLQGFGVLNRQELAKAVVFTEVPNLALLRSGGPGIAPSWFLNEAAWVVEQAREMADVVIVDTGPLLATIEAATLVPSADALLLVTRSGRVSRTEARRTTEQLSRLGAMVCGVAVVGVERSETYGYYHRPLPSAAARGESLSS